MNYQGKGLCHLPKLKAENIYIVCCGLKMVKFIFSQLDFYFPFFTTNMWHFRPQNSPYFSVSLLERGGPKRIWNKHENGERVDCQRFVPLVLAL